MISTITVRIAMPVPVRYKVRLCAAMGDYFRQEHRCYTGIDMNRLSYKSYMPPNQSSNWIVVMRAKKSMLMSCKMSNNPPYIAYSHPLLTKIDMRRYLQKRN